MFTAHFKMTRQPFLERPAAEHILRDERLAEGLARLEYLAETGSIGLVTGQTGVGKSTLIRLFVQSLSPNRFQPIYLSLTNVQPSGLLKLILSSLGEQPRRGKEHLFVDILEKVEKLDHTTLLIIDECHLIPAETLTDLRLLVSSGLDEAPRLKILLSGQEPVRKVLQKGAHADLLHRISVRYHVPPFSREETAAYIDFQLKSAEVSTKLFDKEAKYLLHDYASGVARQINSHATACLLNAAAKNQQKVSEALVNETMSEFRLP